MTLSVTAPGDANLSDATVRDRSCCTWMYLVYSLVKCFLKPSKTERFSQRN